MPSAEIIPFRTIPAPERPQQLREEIAGYMQAIGRIEMERREIVAEHLELVKMEQGLQQDMRTLLNNAGCIEQRLLQARSELEAMS